MADPPNTEDPNTENEAPSDIDTPEQRILVRDPYVMIYASEIDDATEVKLHPGEGMTVTDYAMLIWHLVGRIAEQFDTDEEAVWAAIDAERDSPSIL